MESGIVYFTEIIENISDITYDNLRPLYNKIRRFVFNAEQDIGTGGVCIIKKKEYTKGDGFYDGSLLVMPEDFAYEWSYGSLGEMGVLQGNTLRLFNPGPDKLDLSYLGFLMDEAGNPFTTRNHLDAVVKHAVFKLYSRKYFLGNGNQNQYRIYQQEYNDSVLAARGHDAFPTEEEWKQIGHIKHGGAFEAMTNCGLMEICPDNNPVITDITTPKPEPVCKEFIEGKINGWSTTVAAISFDQIKFAKGIISNSSSVSATLKRATKAEFRLQGTIESQTTISGILVNKIKTINCSESFRQDGGQGVFNLTMNVGSDIGLTGILATAFNVPDRFKIFWNGNLVADSKFIGTTTQEQALLDLGYTQADLNLTSSAAVDVPVLFNKTSATPATIEIEIDGPFSGTLWEVKGVCPFTGIKGKAVVSGTLNRPTLQESN